MMKAFTHTLGLSISLTGFAIADHHGDPSLSEQLDKLIEAVSVTDEAARYEPRMAMQDLTSHANAPSAKQRDEWVKLLLDRVQNDKTLNPGKAWIIRQLENIGQAESVPTLVRFMGSPLHHHRELARRALEKNPSSEATTALRELAAKEADRRTKRALVHSLGERRDRGAVTMLGEIAGDKDRELASDAITALGKIASGTAQEALIALAKGVNGPKRIEIADALLQTARILVQEGQTTQAEALLEKLYYSDQPANIQAAALRGLLLAAPDKAEDRIIFALQSKAAAVRLAAVTACRNIEPPSIITNILAVKLPDLAPHEQSVTLSVLEDSGDTTVAPLLGKLIEKSETSEDQQIALLGALASLGGTDAVEIALAAAGRSEGTVQQAARDALRSMPGRGVEAALLAASNRGDAMERSEAIAALGDRDHTPAVNILLSYADNEAKVIRRASLAALGNLVSGDQVRLLTERLSLDEKVVPAIIAACRRTATPQAAPAVIKAIHAADVKTKGALLTSLSHLGGEEALNLVKGLLGDAELGNPARRALLAWRRGEAAPVILDLAKSDQVSADDQPLILRGLGDLLGKDDSGLSHEERSKFALAAMEIAKRPEEQRHMISVLGSVGSKESVDVIKKCLNEKDVAGEAAKAASQIAHRLRETDREIAIGLIEAITESKASDKTVRQARRLLDRMKE